MSPVQMESGLSRLVCPTCDGTGEVDGRPVCASRFSASSSCGCGGRMCGFTSVRCPDCRGSGCDESAYEDCCPICNEYDSECACAEQDEAAA